MSDENADPDNLEAKVRKSLAADFARNREILQNGTSKPLGFVAFTSPDGQPAYVDLARIQAIEPTVEGISRNDPQAAALVYFGKNVSMYVRETSSEAGALVLAEQQALDKGIEKQFVTVDKLSERAAKWDRP